jgi:hypothetical protein
VVSDDDDDDHDDIVSWNHFCDVFHFFLMDHKHQYLLMFLVIIFNLSYVYHDQVDDDIKMNHSPHYEFVILLQTSLNDRLYYDHL